jgi:transcription factor SOX7/8/10/18 (SOX group E/F)
MFPPNWNPTHPDPSMTAQPAGDDDQDNSRRPPNAFILYSQAMRSAVRNENPTLSNIEVSRLLGQMWKEVPPEVKLQYKQRAIVGQEQFKREHPNYTYRKARRKRALNELLTKSTQGFPMGGFPGDPSQMFNAAANPYFAMQMFQQPGAQGAVPPGHPGLPGAGMMGVPGQQQQQPYPNWQQYPGMPDASAFQYPPK